MSFKKLSLWYLMLTKRLFCKFSFVILLCCIPIMILVTNYAMSGESGVLTVMLCSEDKDSGAEEIINSLLNEDSVILFKYSDNPQSAIDEVKQHKADAVWCFEDDFSQKITAYATHKSTQPIVKVYEREDSIPLQLSKEKLYGAIYSSFSYEVYKNFVYSELVDVNQLSEKELEAYFNGTKTRDDIVELEKREVASKNKNAGYLLAPLRGIMALLVVLCGLAAAMYYLKDKREGKFDWMPCSKRIIPAFAQCLAAVVPAGVAVLASIYIGGIARGVTSEFISMLLFVTAVSGFCLVMCIIFKYSGKLAASIPAMIVIMLAFSPVFFNLNMLKPLSLMLPTYHYLMAVYSGAYTEFLIYIVCVYGFALLLNRILNRK